MTKSQVSIVKCATYLPGELLLKIKEGLELIGGITNFVKPNSKVLLKPNLLMAIEPERAITTHPEFVRAVIKILKEINCKIYLGDGPSVFGGNIEDVFKVYERTGMRGIAEEEGIELVTFDKRFIPPLRAGAGFVRDYFPLANWVKECDYIVNLPKFKTHDYMILTGAVKNLFGLIPGTFKLECHKNFYQPEKFAQVLLDIYQAVKPAISILDGISGIEGNGPATSGTKREFGLILASSDAVAIDALLAKIINIPLEYIFTNKEAMKREAGNTNLNNIEIRGESLASCLIKDFKLPETSLKQTIKNRLPGPIVNILKGLLTFYPKIDSDVCQLCEACVKNCPQKIMSNKNGKIEIDYSQCISCFCCREVCPSAAIRIKKSLLARLLKM